MSFIVSFQMVDAYERPVSKSFETDSTVTDYTEALAAAADLATDLGNISEARILSYTVTGRVVYTDTVVSGANKDEGCTLVLRKSDNYKDILKIPAPINAIFDTDGTVLLANAAVTAYVSHFLTSGGFVFSDGEQGVELVSGRLDK
jgi:hypothetical protein